MLAGLVDLALSLGPIMVVFPISISLVFYIFYYFSRFKAKFRASILPFSIIALLSLSFGWFFNSGYDGPVIFVFFDAFLISLIISAKKGRKYMLFLYIITLTVIIWTYNFKPEMFDVYQNKSMRFYDLLLTLIYSIVIMYFIVIYLLNNYHSERAKVEKERIEVSKANSELMSKQIQLEKLNKQLLEKNDQIIEQKYELEVLNDNLTETYIKISKQNTELESLNSELQIKNLEIENQRDKSEKLLLNILPETIATRLKEGETNIADNFSEASVVFIDMTSFTAMSNINSPENIIDILNKIYTEFDKIAEKYHLEKIKTIGDCYMAASGIPEEREDHAIAAANFAIESMLSMSKNNYNFENVINENNPLQFRCGIECGPVIAGVIGEKKFSYDLWGDTVNIASRMEQYGEPGKIQVTERFQLKVNEFSGKNNCFKFISRGEVEVKGIGFVKTYFLDYENFRNE